MKAVLALLIVVTVCKSIVAENILFLQTLPSKSHHIWNKQIIERLYDNGHNLTILSFFEEKSVPGKTYLVAKDFMSKIMAEYENEWDFTAELDPFSNIKGMYDYYTLSSSIISGEDAFLELLKYPRSFRFDLIIHDFTMGQFLLGLVDYFGNPPLVSLTAFNIPSYTITLADAPLRTTYMPHYTAEFSNRMSLVERFKNTLFWAFDIFYRNQIYMPKEDRLSKKLFGKDTTSIGTIEKQSDLILVNCDFSMDYYQSLPPNVIPVAGLHVNRKDDLTSLIKQFIARADKGIILLSFGTLIATEMLGEQANAAIMNVFRSMPDYGFIWKHGDPASLGVMPPNVLVVPWVPQSAVLANQRTKLLISHGGLLSLQEASWYGVPVIAVPFFVDQQSNTDKLERAGVGTKLLPRDINEENLKKTILSITGNESYRSNMKKRSQLFRAQPEHPLDRAIFWIEKVIENKGLAYLRSPGHDMNLIQLYGLDMIGIVVLVILSCYMVIRKLVGSTGKSKGKQKAKKA